MLSRCSKITVFVLVTCLSSGCSSFKPRETVFDPEAPRMSTIFSRTVDSSSHTGSRAVISPNPNPGREALEGYTRDAQDEVRQLFPKIPNPTLVLYVFPHIASGNVPIPGFSTAFELYERQHYALPGEVKP